MDAPLHAMLAGRAGLPHDLEPDLAGNALLIEDHLARDEAQQLLALGRGGRRSVPYSWQVLAQNLQRAPIGLAQDERLRAAPPLVFLFDCFHGAQLLFPGPLQRARHQPVLGLDRVVLAPGPLGLVAGALAPQCPLLLQPVRFLLQLPESGDGNGDPVGREGVEKRVLDKDIDGESAHFLAQRAGLAVAVGAAAIDGIIALRAGVAQAHAPPAAPAYGDALQQRAALTRDTRMAGRVTVGIVRQALLIGHERLPGEVAGMRRRQADRPLAEGDLGRRRACAAPPAHRIGPPATVDVSPGIGGVVQNVVDARAVGFTPQHLVRRRAAQRPNRQRQVVGLQIAHHPACALQLGEFGENQLQAGLHLLIGIADDRPGAVVGQPGRQGNPQLATGRFLALALMQAQADLVQLGFTHDPRQAEQQPVMVGGRIVKALAVGQDHAEQRAQFEQLMPIAVVARQPRGIEAEHQPGIAQPDLGNQPLEAVPFGARRPRFAEILVDDADALAWPAEPDGTVDKAILQFGAFLVLADLVDRGLAHIDIGQLGTVRRADPLVSTGCRAQHRTSPSSSPLSAPSGAVARREAGPSVFASRSAGSARAATVATRVAQRGAGWATDGAWSSRVTSSTAMARWATI